MSLISSVTVPVGTGFFTTSGSSVLLDVNLEYGTSNYQNDILVSDIHAINNEIFDVMTCVIGSDEMEPLYGSRIPYLLWEPLDARTAWLIETAIFDAALAWLPRISLNMSQTYVLVDEENEQFVCQINYTIVKTNLVNAFNVALPSSLSSGSTIN